MNSDTRYTEYELLFPIKLVLRLLFFMCICHKQGYIRFLFKMFYKHNTIRKLIEIYDLCFALKVEKEDEKFPLTAGKMLKHQKYLIINHLRC